ncbi:uncharacterized protein LOC111862426 [Cryptotermes secundus]|uniref:uncharacterized protein LOC111862426 n=1 Tax=Cryptotermes secundus TaxID=105785 RepID=UPI001454E034|nr:uncharacterized protein LOC111862426 [Cryptotermes secundus]
MDYLQKWNNFEESMKNVRLLFAMAFVSWIHLSLRFNKAKIEYLLHFTDTFTWEEMPTRDPETGSTTMAGSIQRTQTILKYVAIFMFTFHGIQSSLHMWKNHDMVFDTWYPFQVTNSPVYEVINVIQFSAFVLVTSMYVSLQGVYATLVYVACSQLEKLRANLSLIGEGRVTTAQESRVNPGSEKMQKQLNDCIRHHQIIQLYVHNSQ